MGQYACGGGRAAERRLFGAWGALYAGQLVADDIRDFARDHIGSNVAGTCGRHPIPLSTGCPESSREPPRTGLIRRTPAYVTGVPVADHDE